MSKKINEADLLEIFFKTSKAYHLREIARLCKMSPATAAKYLDELVKRGLLLREESHAVTLYTPNVGSEEYRFEKKIRNLQLLRSSGLLSHLDQTYEYPAIILFGSFAKGEDGQKSDIDLFIIASEKKDIDLAKFEKHLGRPIQLFVHTRDEFKKFKKTEPALLNNVLNGIILRGFVEVY